MRRAFFALISLSILVLYLDGALPPPDGAPDVAASVWRAPELDSTHQPSARFPAEATQKVTPQDANAYEYLVVSGLRVPPAEGVSLELTCGWHVECAGAYKDGDGVDVDWTFGHAEQPNLPSFPVYATFIHVGGTSCAGGDSPSRVWRVVPSRPRAPRPRRLVPRQLLPVPVRHGRRDGHLEYGPAAQPRPPRVGGPRRRRLREPARHHAGHGANVGGLRVPRRGHAVTPASARPCALMRIPDRRPRGSDRTPRSVSSPVWAPISVEGFPIGTTDPNPPAIALPRVATPIQRICGLSGVATPDSQTGIHAR